MVRGESGRGAQHRAEDRRGRGGARGGAQGARADPAQGRARHGLAARQARRLPGARSRQVRAVPGRGRFSRRQRQAGARPRLPGRAPLARQDPQCRAGALRQDAVVAGDRHADHRARHRHRPGRVRPRQAPLSQDHHHDRRRCRRLAYPHAAAHLLLPADAVADRGRASLHRPAAALQGEARPVRALPQGREGARGLSHRRRAGGRRARHRRQREPRRRRFARHRRDRAQDQRDPQRPAQPLSALHRRAGGDRRRAQSRRC